MENYITRRKALGLAAASLVSPYLITRAQAATTPVLVELFTSQGCSSCPPADKLAAELTNQPGVTVVTFNVDYWDYLGWKDTLAQPEYTKRQMDYAHARGDTDVYTPQMIFNGAAHGVGSSKSAVAKSIVSAQSTELKVPLQLRMTGQNIVAELPSATADGDATVWLMAIAPSVSVKIGRGENSGSTIIYHNVVRKLVKAGTWKGEAATFTFAKADVMLPDCKSCIAVLQEDELGPVMGMASLGI
jgi:hypothetical protein